ncbi:deoxyribodipyrimidine photo-lyase [Pseudomonas sp. HK3]|jgi:deoxyribodipyrimidine photo-lyase
MNLMWFRSDLRVHDNPALYASMQADATVAVYCLTPGQWQIHYVAPIQQDFILRQLAELASSLQALGVPLIIIDAKDFSGVPAKLASVVKKYAIEHVYFNHEYEWNEAQLTELVSAQLAVKDISIHSLHDQCLIPPGEIKNKQDSFYKVFTAFKNVYLSELNEKSRPLYRKPNTQNPIKIKPDSSILHSIKIKGVTDVSAEQKQTWLTLWPVGEEYPLSLLEQFVDEQIYQYHELRDIPSVTGTSKLSAYLAIGAISVRQCFQSAVTLPNGLDNEGVKTWVVELIWRDFYRHLMVACPEICRYKPFKSHTDQLPWKHNNKLFKAWCEGRTGFPLVDAAMRQLVETGWMHNRLRMVSAMFLTKHLFIDWRLGEQFFMQHLVDGDLASNNGGWQWSASTGVDAVPYFRIFNPTRQSQRFDEAGTFIRQYVPELASLDKKSIHQPSAQQIKQCGYVSPVVDHKTAVAQTKMYFKQLSDPVSENKKKEYGLS